MQRAINIGIVTALGVLGFAIDTQRRAIDELTEAVATGTQIEYELTVHVLELERRVDEHMAVIEGLEKDLDFVQQQADILMAASRSGKNGHLVIGQYMARGE